MYHIYSNYKNRKSKCTAKNVLILNLNYTDLSVDTMMKYFLSDFGVAGNFSNMIP